MANRVLLGKKGSDYVLQISKPGTDVTGSVNTRDLLFNSLDNYRSGVIVSDTDVDAMTTSGVNLPTTADANSNNYIPAYQVIEKGVRTPVYYFIDDRTTGGVGFDFEATMQSGVPTTGGGGLFEFSLSGSGSTVNTVKAAFIDIVESEPIVNHGLSGYDYFGTNNYPFIELRTRGSSDGTVNILMLRIPCQYGKMTNDATLFGTSVLTPATSGGGGSGGGGSISAPADPTVTLSTRTSTTDTVSVSSSSGSGNSGTITFAQTTTNVTPSSGFTTTTSYSQPRNSTRYYWASQGGYISDSTSFVSPAYDNTPNQFTFNDVTGALLNTVYTSNEITVGGLDNNDSATVSITGGTYSKNGGAYTSSNGTAVNTDKFTVKQTSSSSYATAVNCTLTIGTISDTYTVTTGAAAPSNPTVSFSSRNNTNETVTVSSSSGSGNSGTITYAQTTTNSSSGASFTTTTTYSQPRGSTRYYWAQQGGLISGSTSYTSPALDQSPTAFSFNDITGAELNTVYTSTPAITVAGLDYGDSATVSITGGTYSKNTGAYTSSNGTAVNGDTFTVRQTSSGSFSTTTNCTLYIGTENDTYSVTTKAADTTPDAYDFTNQSGQELSTLTYSNEETITGLNTGASVSISGNSAQFSIAGGAYTTSGTITNGQSLRLRMNSSSSYSTAVSTTVNVGGVTDGWSITTRAQVLASPPTAITATQISNPSGSASVDATASGGSGTIQVSNNNSNWYSNGQDFTHARNTTVTYYARCVSTDNNISSTISTNKFVPPVVSLGAISDKTFTYSAFNNSYTVTSERAAGNYNTYSSDWGTTVTTISNNSNGGWLTSTITNSSAGSYSLSASSYPYIGVSRSATVTYTTYTSYGYQQTLTFTVTQNGIPQDSIPDQYTWNDVSNANLSTYYYDSETITGINVGTYLTFTGSSGAAYSVNGGAYSTGNTFVYNNDIITARVLSSFSFNTSTVASFNIGGIQDTFTVTTQVQDSTPDAFSFTDETNQAGSTTIVSDYITVSGINVGVTASLSGYAAEMQVNSGTWTSSNQTVYNNDQIRLRLTSSSSSNTTTTATLTVGGVSDDWSVTTGTVATLLWGVALSQGSFTGGSTSFQGYSSYIGGGFGTTSDTSCDIANGTTTWSFYDIASSGGNTLFTAASITSNSGWTTLKIYFGVNNGGTLLATIARTSTTYSNPGGSFATWDLGADYTSSSGNLYLEWF